MRPRQLVQAWVEAFNRADPDALAAFYAEDAVNHQVAESPLRGRAAIREMFAAGFAATTMVCVVEQILEDGEWAMLEWRDPLGLRGCGVFHVVDGVIRFQRGYWDKLSFLRAHRLPMPEGRNLASISPFFIVRDLQASVAHYVDRLGFTLDFEGPPEDAYYAHVSRDGIGIMLKAITPEVLPRPNHTRHAWARWDAYIYTRDPDTLFAEFQRRGAAFVQELSFIDDGLWGFEVTDADGYVLAFFSTREG